MNEEHSNNAICSRKTYFLCLYIKDFWRFSGVLVHLIFHKINFFFLHSLSTNGLLYVNMLLGRLTIGFRCVQRLLLGHTFTNTNWSHSMYAAALFHWIFFLFLFLTNVAYHTNKYHTILIRIIAHFCNQFGSSFYVYIMIMRHPVIWSTILL